jgi:hypothetical protein
MFCLSYIVEFCVVLLLLISAAVVFCGSRQVLLNLLGLWTSQVVGVVQRGYISIASPISSLMPRTPLFCSPFSTAHVEVSSSYSIVSKS